MKRVWLITQSWKKRHITEKLGVNEKERVFGQKTPTTYLRASQMNLLSEDEVGEECNIVLSGSRRSRADPRYHVSITSSTSQQGQSTKVLSLMETFLGESKLTPRRRQFRQLLPLLLRLLHTQIQTVPVMYLTLHRVHTLFRNKYSKTFPWPPFLQGSFSMNARHCTTVHHFQLQFQST